MTIHEKRWNRLQDSIQGHINFSVMVRDPAVRRVYAKIYTTIKEEMQQIEKELTE
jgi:hypothetical protein